MFGHRHISVFGAFAPVNVNHLSFTIDVEYLKKKGFLEPQRAGADGGQKNHKLFLNIEERALAVGFLFKFYGIAILQGKYYT